MVVLITKVKISKTLYNVLLFNPLMNDLLSTVHIKVNEGIYLKDPDSSELGKGIVSEGLLLIDELGWRKQRLKTCQRLGTTEASIYRYLKVNSSCWFI